MSEFKSHHVVPDVIDTWPGAVAQLEYDSKNVVNTGNTLEIHPTQNQPGRIYWDHEKGAHNYYTLMMVDPDAPNPKTHEYRHWLHWLIVNIPSSAASGDHIDVRKGHTVAAYKGPAPPAHTGPHRYVFLIYRQPQQLDTMNLSNIHERQGFKIDSWLDSTFGSGKDKEKPELVAGNFFYAEHEQKEHKHEHHHKN